MELTELKVLHWRGPHEAGGPLAWSADAGAGPCGDAFLIDTCQRRVAVLRGNAPEAGGRERPADRADEVFEATAAYGWLLRFACGLESKLVAETEIFGQLKQAWREFSSRGSALGRQLTPWMQRLFEDAKAVRAQYLSSLGSASYGSQVRRLLGTQTHAGPTLLVGAGQLAQSVAPWLTGSQLWLWNRTRERAVELARELAKRSPERPVQVLDEGAEAELRGWRGALNVVVCVPADAVRDAQRIAAWRAREPQHGRLIHLGLARELSGGWESLPGMAHLGALFNMLQEHSQQRQRQLERARRACAEKALLRSLGASATQSHSWEDLAAFTAL